MHNGYKLYFQFYLFRSKLKVILVQEVPSPIVQRNEVNVSTSKRVKCWVQI